MRRIIFFPIALFFVLTELLLWCWDGRRMWEWPGTCGQRLLNPRLWVSGCYACGLDGILEWHEDRKAWLCPRCEREPGETHP